MNYFFRGGIVEGRTGFGRKNVDTLSISDDDRCSRKIA
jgi:hypothetical protein